MAMKILTASPFTTGLLLTKYIAEHLASGHLLKYYSAKEKSISAQQYASLRNQVVKYVALFTKRTAAAKRALRKLHQFGQARKTNEIPLARYRNALQAISKARKSAYNASQEGRFKKAYEGFGLIPRQRSYEPPSCKIRKQQSQTSPGDSRQGACDGMLDHVFRRKPQTALAHLRLVYSRD